jgi:hypothetical protein
MYLLSLIAAYYTSGPLVCCPKQNKTPRHCGVFFSTDIAARASGWPDWPDRMIGRGRELEWQQVLGLLRR